jgi:hypothetical protein
MKKKKMVFVCCFLLMVATGIRAQSHTDASGGNVSGSGGTASYSVGQIDYTTIKGSGGIATEGVQQPLEIFQVTTGIDEVSNDEVKAMVFPNPTSSFVELQISNSINGQLIYKLYDQNGSFITQESISGSATMINLTSLQSGIYFLKVINSAKIIKTFKIVKAY